MLQNMGIQCLWSDPYAAIVHVQELQTAGAKHEGGYLFPLSAEAEAAFEAAWGAESDGRAMEGSQAEANAQRLQQSVVLPVMFGRTLQVDRRVSTPLAT